MTPDTNAVSTTCSQQALSHQQMTFCRQQPHFAIQLSEKLCRPEVEECAPPPAVMHLGNRTSEMKEPGTAWVPCVPVLHTFKRLLLLLQHPHITMDSLVLCDSSSVVCHVTCECIFPPAAVFLNASLSNGPRKTFVVLPLGKYLHFNSPPHFKVNGNTSGIICPANVGKQKSEAGREGSSDYDPKENGS